jgi:thiol-disulfide isomerase/thioredoxin
VIAVRAALVATVLVACSRDAERPAPAPGSSAGGAQAAPADVAAPPFAIVPLSSPEDDAVATVVTRARASIAAGRRPLVQMWASWCPTCQETDDELADARVRAELAGIELLRIDVDAWGAAIDGTALEVKAVPTFLQISPTGEPTGKRITSAAWNGGSRPMAAVLRSFASGR